MSEIPVGRYEFKATLSEEQRRYLALTPREKEVLQGLCEGRMAKRIAQDLGISAKTVDTHRCNLYRKLEVDSMAALVKFAVRNGLTSA